MSTEHNPIVPAPALPPPEPVRPPSQPVYEVDWFRRMPNGGGTVFVEPRD